MPNGTYGGVRGGLNSPYSIGDFLDGYNTMENEYKGCTGGILNGKCRSK